MQSSSRAVAALRRSARKNRGVWSSLQQKCIKLLPASSGDAEWTCDSKPVVEEENIKKVSACSLAGRSIHERRLIFGATAINGKQASNLLSLNTSTIARRKFASRSKGGDDDEDVYDDFESRLIREDYEPDDTYAGASSYGMGAANAEDYGEWEKAEDNDEWAKAEDDDDDEDSDEDSEGSDDEDAEGLEGSEDSDDSEDSFANDPSDEEFEDERTDEELDELLANTPLFEPPDVPDFVSRDKPEPEFSFRPEGPIFYPGMQYDPEYLDVTRPLPPQKRQPKIKEEFSVEDVIDKADFRNVRFLTKFISESGTIIARKEFKMRTKSHNRVVKAIKTARFFGLMPYTNMGRPRYVFNEPFYESDEYYETDEEDLRSKDMAAARTYQGNVGSSWIRDATAGRNYQGNVSNSRFRGGNSNGQERGSNNFFSQARGGFGRVGGQSIGQRFQQQFGQER